MPVVINEYMPVLNTFGFNCCFKPTNEFNDSKLEAFWVQEHRSPSKGTQRMWDFPTPSTT